MFGFVGVGERGTESVSGGWSCGFYVTAWGPR